ncbi:remodeling and spacing factor 1-like [Exaiptasia diaphana]|uniref:DDT domain-containing protein n=1 Tax=Exaiptasia diaphana TaxID=2652724 RepID=A0A913YQJ3_EXADI|nr:remodeling and spacing factor 1-like [Exaiptasia diaphana]
MASTGSSDVENEEENTDQTLSPKKVGRAAEYPEFAIIWSYLENFCELLRFPELSLDGLEDAFNSHSPRNENCRQLEYLHKKLLVKLNRRFRPDKWEKALLKIAKEQNMLVSWDLENFGYDQLKIGTKLELFKMLLECQFDTNNKLKTVINKSYEADELRLTPFGHDMDGLLYWFHMDESGGVRLYSTEEDEVENESWKLLASDLEELENVIEYLIIKSETNPKDIVLAKREEERKKNEEKTKTSKKGKKSKKAAAKEEEDDNPCARCYSNVQPDSVSITVVNLKERKMTGL